MSTTGFVEEDDLILYAMQALSPSEMEQVRRRVNQEPELAHRLREIEQVLGSYASATIELQEVPSAALDRLTGAISTQQLRDPAPRPVPAPLPVPAPRPVVKDSSRKPGWGGLGLGLLWGGWAVAALLLVGLGFQYQQNRRVQQTVAANQTSLQAAQAQTTALQAQAAALAADRDRLQALSQQTSQEAHVSQQEAEASRQEASNAQSHSADVNAKLAAARLQAQLEAARADQLASTARDAADQRNQLNAALTREQQAASQAAESQQVLAALADPSALHVPLTVPKQKKRPSGRGTYLASTGTLVFTGSDLGSLPAGKVYELWLMPADGSAPIPAGTFSPDATGNATLISSHFQKVSAKGFAITVENAGGSLKPTLPILLAGAA